MQFAMVNSNLIFTLTAVDENARQVCLNPYNLIRNPQPSLSNDDGHSVFSNRDSTPLQPQQQIQPQLHFTFDREPRNPHKGFTFGSDDRKCDIVIGKKRRDAISGCHFCITVNAKDRVILKDVSTIGTHVSYDGQGGYCRTNFQWIIFPDYINIIITVRPSAPTIRSFKIKVAKYDPSNTAHQALLDSYLMKGQTALPLSLIHVHNKETTMQPTGYKVPTQGHIYIKDELLKKDGFGKVYRVKDVSSGNQYADKVFDRFPQEWKREIKILERLSHVSTNINT